MAETPQGCVEHQPKYKAKAWEAYSLHELGMWVHLLTKRAEHRSDIAKRKKDLHDAQNYLDMMQSKLRQLRYENSDLMLEVKRLAPDAYKVEQVYAFVVGDVLKDDKLGYVIPTNNFDWYDGNAILPLENFIVSMRVHHSNLFNLHLKVRSDHLKESKAHFVSDQALANAETVALHKVADVKHKRNVAQQQQAAGLDPSLPESDAFSSCPKMTDSERS